MKKGPKNYGKKVHFKDNNIELSNKFENKTKENILKKNETEEEDILKKFKEKKRRKNLNKSNFKREMAFSTIKHQIKEEFSLGKLGKIEWAKEHASSNRPLNKIKEFTKSTKFCNCCNLPCETPGIMEHFSFCENTENFSICGKAVPLYFYFIRYCILCLTIILLIMSIPITIFNNKYLSNIENYCDNFKINGDILLEEVNITLICQKYSEKNSTQFSIFVDWFWKISIDNIIDYKNLMKTIDEKDIDKSIINYSIIGFCCMISLFIINIYFIILFKAKIKADKIGNIQPSDYTVLITDLQKMVNEFREKNGEINILSNENNDIQNNLISTVSDYEYININYMKSQIGQFNQFLKDNLFYSQKSKKNLNVFNLNLCYKLNDFMILKEKQEKCKYKIFQILNNPYQIEKNEVNNFINNNRRYYTSLFNYIGLNCLYCSNNGISLEQLNKEKDIYESNLNTLVSKAKLNNFCGCIFATFNTIKDKQDFYNNFPHFFIESVFYYIKNIKYYICCCFIDEKNRKNRKKERIRVYLAPEPEDVIWENMEFTLFQRFYRIIIIYSLSIFLILIAFYLVYILNDYKERTDDKNWAQILKYIVSFSITIIISILNFILKFIMKYFTKIEKQKSMTNYYLSFSIKLTIFTFMTSALVPFFSNYISFNLENHDNKNLITNMFFIFLTNSFLNPILWAINIQLIIKKIRIYFIERKKIPNSMHFKTQKELNDLYEYPDMDIASKYSYISMTLLMTMFYLPIFPLGVLFSLVGFLLTYFVEKYNFIHGYKRPEMLNEKLGEFHFNFFISIIVSYGIGNYFFTKGLFLKDSWPFIIIIIFCILSIIPYTKPITYYFNSNKDFDDVNSKPINDIYFSFFNDYQRQNPFTKKEGMYFYIHELKNKGYISKFIYDILIKNVEKINVMEIYYNTTMNPNLKEIKRSLTRVNNKKFSMIDLKKSITRIFNEKLKNANRKNNLELIEKYKGNDIETNSNSEETEEEKNSKIDTVNNINDNNENYNITNNISNKNDSKDNNNIKNRRYTENKEAKKLNKLYDNNDISCLTQVFKEKDLFLINQYKNPLLLSIGEGIKNLAFVDNNDFNELNKKSNLSKIPSISEEENVNSEENLLIEDKEPEEEDNEEEKDDDNNLIE